jgi:hypothetical protein
VKLTVQSPTKLPTALNVPLNLKNGQFSAVVNNLVVASDYIFSASAIDSTSTTIFHGTASSVTITSGSTAQVTLYLSQVNPQGISNKVPVIDSVSFDSNQVGQGGTVHLTAAAHDPDAGQTASLTFTWLPAAGCGAVSLQTATGGSDTTDRNATALYTAPFANVDCQINLTVTDAFGGSNQAAFSIRVGLGSAGSGNAKVSALVNGAPIITSLTATPAQIIVNSTVTPPFPVLAVAATDPENDTLSYSWQSTTPGCTVAWGPGQNSASTTFAVSAVATGTTACVFTVSVNDGVWPGTSIVKNTVVSSLTLPVGSQTVLQPPLFGLTYQSDSTVTGGEPEVLAAVATDPAGGTLSYTYSWAVDTTTGTSFVTATPASLSLDPIFTTAGTWTAPAGAQSASTATFTVTAKSSVSNLTASTTFVFAPANNPCIGVADNTTCSIPSNLCIVNATCQGGACVGSQKTCPPSTTACQDNTCAPATGVCGLAPQAAGSACTDGNGCTSGDKCNAAGTCVTTPVACPAPLACQVSDVCVSTGDATFTCQVTNASAGTTCDADSNPCTAGDACNSSGTCVAGTTDPCPAAGYPVSATICAATSSTAFTCSTPACMDSVYAKQIFPPFIGSGVGADGSVWITGNIYNPFDFTTNTNACSIATDPTCVTSSGSSDIYLAKLNASGLATTTKVFGTVAPTSTDQFASGVAVAANGNVGLIGTFIGEIDFTGNDSNGSGNGSGAQNTDYLLTSSTIPFWATFDSAGTAIKSHKVDVGTGALLSIASNPNRTEYAICGKTSKAVGLSTTGTGLLTTAASYVSGNDIVVAKINASTGAVIWGLEFGGAQDQSCQSVAIDNNGDVIIAGNYNGTLAFGGATSPLPTVSDTTAALLYVAKLNGTTGAAIAASTWGTAGKVIPYGVTVDANSNIIVAGSMGGDLPFGGSNNLVNSGLTDAFVAKLTTSGASFTTAWAKSFGDAAYDQQARGVAVSSNGDVYVAGLFEGTMSLAGSPAITLSANSNANTDAFVAHLAAADGSAACGHLYGDALGSSGVTSITVARATDNAVVIGGGFASKMTFTSGVLDTGAANLAQSYVARLAP